MKTINFTLAALVLLGLAACNKTESGNTDDNVNNDPNHTEETDYSYDESTGTYTVYTANGLLVWNEAVQNDLSLNCTLASDIDLTDINLTKSDSTGTEWTPIGNYNDRYTGTFEGGYHTIKGLTVNQRESDYVGLIGFLGSDGKVQNLTLENMDISGDFWVGGVVGWNGGTVTNCSVSGSVSATSRAGGVVGTNGGTVTACSASGSISGTDSIESGTVGGVVGYNDGGTMTACYHISGSVVSDNSYVGGVVAQNDEGTVTACYHASGSVSGMYYVGGVVGYSYFGTVTACYWSDYAGNGIGENHYGTGEPTKVNGTNVSWQDAVDDMNAAIDTWNSNNTDPNKQCDWKYELIGDLPTLTKN